MKQELQNHIQNGQNLKPESGKYGYEIQQLKFPLPINTSNRFIYFATLQKNILN
jgi:hypothetical protein